MKKFYRILALLLVVCLFCSAVSAAGITEEEEHNHGIVEEGTTETLSIVQETTEESEPVSAESSSNAAESVPTTETVSQDTEMPDRMTWTLDENGTLWIGGKGIMKPIHSAEEQPWAKVRTQIQTVRFRSDAHLLIDDIAYWFSGCTNLVYAELPAYVFAVGMDAFKGCDALEEVVVFASISVKDETLPLTRVSISEHVSVMATGGPCGISGCTCTTCITPGGSYSTTIPIIIAMPTAPAATRTNTPTAPGSPTPSTAAASARPAATRKRPHVRMARPTPPGPAATGTNTATTAASW